MIKFKFNHFWFVFLLLFFLSSLYFIWPDKDLVINFYETGDGTQFEPKVTIGVTLMIFAVFIYMPFRMITEPFFSYWLENNSLFIKKFGKTKILPNISPKKSWEGFAGGLFFSIIASSILYFSFSTYFDNISNIAYILISIVLPFTATTGDFIESYYKRKAGVKDSGKIMPGHGGILDRMDAFLITIPVIYIIINLT